MRRAGCGGRSAAGGVQSPEQSDRPWSVVRAPSCGRRVGHTVSSMEVQVTAETAKKLKDLAETSGRAPKTSSRMRWPGTSKRWMGSARRWTAATTISRVIATDRRSRVRRRHASLARRGGLASPSGTGGRWNAPTVVASPGGSAQRWTLEMQGFSELRRAA